MFLAIDLGSTNIKAAVYDAELQQRGVGSHRLRYAYGAGGVVEIPVEEARLGFHAAVESACKHAGIASAEIRAAALTSQAQTFTLLDASGRALIPFISWQDTRAIQGAAALRDNPALADFATHCSFDQILDVLHVCQLKEISLTDAALLADTKHILHLPTYFVRECTGHAVIDTNLAAMSGLYSLELNDWWPAMTDACGITRAQLPELIAMGESAGTTTEAATALGLPAGIPLVLAGNDQTAGALGVELYAHGGALLTLGTAQVAYACADTLCAPEEGVIRGPYPGGRFYRMGADGCGGNLVNWAQTILNDCGTDEAFFAQAATVDDLHGLVFEPDLPAGTGAWRNIGLQHTPAHFARALVESLCARMRGMVERLQISSAGETALLVAGGGSRCAFWVNLLSATLGMPLEPTKADPLLGAARLAQAAAG